jgi:hypothetical protein
VTNRVFVGMSRCGKSVMDGCYPSNSSSKRKGYFPSRPQVFPFPPFPPRCVKGLR